MRSHPFALAAGIGLLVFVTFLSAQQPAIKSRAGMARPRVPGAPPLTGIARPGNSSAITLTNLPLVQEELGLTPEQQQQIADLRQQTAQRQRELYEKMQKDSLELIRQADTSTQALLNAQQAKRLGQLRLQRRGPIALTWPEIAEALQLSVEQRDKLKKLAGEYLDVTGSLGEGDFDLHDTASQLGNGRTREAAKWLAAETLALLTAEQKMKWEELQGERFEFSTGSDMMMARVMARPASGLSRARSERFELGAIPVEVPLDTRGLHHAFGPLWPFRFQLIVEALQLSDEQKTRIATIGAEEVRAIEEFQSRPGQGVVGKVGEINKSTQKKLDGVLTDDQKAKLKELTTAPPPETGREKPAGSDLP